MENLNEKIYIRDNIHKLEYNLINNFIENNDIIYTKNKNGIFFDLNFIPNEKILFLKNLIEDYINTIKLLDKKDIINEKKNDIEKINKNEIKYSENKFIKSKILINDFNNEDKQIIKLSKEY